MLSRDVNLKFYHTLASRVSSLSLSLFLRALFHLLAFALLTPVCVRVCEYVFESLLLGRSLKSCCCDGWRRCSGADIARAQMEKWSKNLSCVCVAGVLRQQQAKFTTPSQGLGTSTTIAQPLFRAVRVRARHTMACHVQITLPGHADDTGL